MPKTRSRGSSPQPRRKKAEKRKASATKALRQKELAEATNRPLRQLLWWLNSHQGLEDSYISQRTGWSLAQIEAVRTGKWQSPASQILELRLFTLVASFTEDTPSTERQPGIPAHFKVPRLNFNELAADQRNDPRLVLFYYRDCALTPRIVQRLACITGGEYAAVYLGSDNVSSSTRWAIIDSLKQHQDYFF